MWDPGDGQVMDWRDVDNGGQYDIPDKDGPSPDVSGPEEWQLTYEVDSGESWVLYWLDGGQRHLWAINDSLEPSRKRDARVWAEEMLNAYLRAPVLSWADGPRHDEWTAHTGPAGAEPVGYPPPF